MRTLSFAIATVIFVSIGGSAVSEEISEDLSKKSQLIVRSPEGAFTPDGLSQIKFGMQRSEVVQILSRYHEVIAVPELNGAPSDQDTFLYDDGKDVHLSIIFYRSDRVYGLMYGFGQVFE